MPKPKTMRNRRHVNGGYSSASRIASSASSRADSASLCRSEWRCLSALTWPPRRRVDECDWARHETEVHGERLRMRQLAEPVLDRDLPGRRRAEEDLASLIRDTRDCPEHEGMDRRRPHCAANVGRPPTALCRSDVGENEPKCHEAHKRFTAVARRPSPTPCP